MAKLYFRYGTVGSAKTLNLLAVAHNYRQQGKDYGEAKSTTELIPCSLVCGVSVLVGR